MPTALVPKSLRYTLNDPRAVGVDGFPELTG